MDLACSMFGSLSRMLVQQCDSWTSLPLRDRNFFTVSECYLVAIQNNTSNQTNQHRWENKLDNNSKCKMHVILYTDVIIEVWLTLFKIIPCVYKIIFCKLPPGSCQDLGYFPCSFSQTSSIGFCPTLVLPPHWKEKKDVHFIWSETLIKLKSLIIIWCFNCERRKSSVHNKSKFT